LRYSFWFLCWLVIYVPPCLAIQDECGAKIQQFSERATIASVDAFLEAYVDKMKARVKFIASRYTLTADEALAEDEDQPLRDRLINYLSNRLMAWRQGEFGELPVDESPQVIVFQAARAFCAARFRALEKAPPTPETVETWDPEAFVDIQSHFDRGIIKSLWLENAPNRLAILVFEDAFERGLPGKLIKVRRGLNSDSRLSTFRKSSYQSFVTHWKTFQSVGPVSLLDRFLPRLPPEDSNVRMTRKKRIAALTKLPTVIPAALRPGLYFVLSNTVDMLGPEYLLSTADFWTSLSEQEIGDGLEDAYRTWKAAGIEPAADDIEVARDIVTVAVRYLYKQIFHERRLQIPDDWNVRLARGEFSNYSLLDMMVPDVLNETVEQWIASRATPKQAEVFKLSFLRRFPNKAVQRALELKDLSYLTPQKERAFSSFLAFAQEERLGLQLALTQDLVSRGGGDNARLRLPVRFWRYLTERMHGTLLELMPKYHLDINDVFLGGAEKRIKELYRAVQTTALDWKELGYADFSGRRDAVRILEVAIRDFLAETFHAREMALPLQWRRALDDRFTDEEAVYAMLPPQARAQAEPVFTAGATENQRRVYDLVFKARVAPYLVRQQMGITTADYRRYLSTILYKLTKIMESQGTIAPAPPYSEETGWALRAG
jgi:hypothetical protein